MLLDQKTSVKLEAGRSYALRGPCAFFPKDGKVFSLGAELKPGRKIAVPDGQTLFLDAAENVSAELAGTDPPRPYPLDRPAVPPDWERTAETLAEPSAIAFTGLGGTAERFFLCFLANRLFAAGRKVAVLHGDPNKPLFGPPACVGLLTLNDPLFFPSAETPTALGYLGRHDLAEKDSAREELERLVAWTLKRRATERILFYLPGWMTVKNGKASSIGNFLKGKTAVLPESIAAGGKTRTVPAFSCPDVFGPEAPPDRTAIYRRYYGGRRFLMLAFHRVKVEGSDFLNGKRADAAGWGKILYAERFPDEKALRIVVRDALSREEASRLKKEFSVRSVSSFSAGAEAGLQVGLCNGRGETLALGVVQKIDYEGRYLEIWTPLPIGKEAEVEIVRFGSVRVTPGGDELAPLPQGAI